MADITLGADRQRHVFERNGEGNSITDFRSVYFESTLDEAQEVPPNPDRAGIDGTGIGALNFARTAFEFSLEIKGINLDGGTAPDDMDDMHIHGGAVGVAGPIVFHFLEDVDDTEVDSDDGTVEGIWNTVEEDAEDMTAGDIAALLDGETYFNIHTNRDLSGFIRGQILRDGSASDVIDLREFNIGSFDTLRAITLRAADNSVIRAFLDGEASALRLDGVAKSALRDGHFIFAGAAAETIDGTADRDDLFGAGGRDTMNGRGGDDRVFGENGADTLSGGRGLDTVVGGLNVDVLKGGADADRFVFNAIAESDVRIAAADRITDFAVDLDKIVLAAIDARTGTSGDQAFTFIGADPFDAAGQARVTHSGGDTFVSLNTTGADGREAVIRLDGNLALAEEDLIL